MDAGQARTIDLPNRLIQCRCGWSDTHTVRSLALGSNVKSAPSAPGVFCAWVDFRAVDYGDDSTSQSISKHVQRLNLPYGPGLGTSCHLST